MKTILAILVNLVIVGLVLTAATDEKDKNMDYNKLTPEEERVIVHKGTEAPFSGQYVNHKDDGTYVCKRCDAPLYRSGDKFDSQCGWPSFDDEIKGAVERKPDADGRRTEILCANCGAHLGHVFKGEGFTNKNIRHCVNSISLNFISEDKPAMESAYFAGGCFWGVEYYFQKADGVISTDVGYMGGEKKNPTYEEVCSGETGHVETMKVVYDPNKTDFETLAKLFFEIHDPTQVDRQGPDIGEQYRSVVFYTDEAQKQITKKLVAILEEKGYNIATSLEKADTFWPAEAYHQEYYQKKGSKPYCHIKTDRF